MSSRDPLVLPFKLAQFPLGGALAAIVALLAIVLLWTSWFTVAPEEVGIVLRLGRFVRQADPGLNVKWPYPIESVLKVPIQRQLKEEFGFRTQKAGISTRFAEGGFARESLMLTGDLNVAIVEWTAQFRVRDPYKFLFKVRAVSSTFRDLNEAVMREVIGDRGVNEVLTIGRQEAAAAAENRLQELCDQYEMGVKVEQIVLQDVNPPDAVKPSFNEVNQAQQEREKLINEARAEYNKVIPKARGEAEQMIQQAEGYRTERINHARGDADLFRSVHASYVRSPEVTRRRIHLETMNAVFPKLKRKIVVDDRLKGLLPLLNLDEAKP
ncbi:MAG: FtsH protease activity modulator HflK [Acidobacteria bacterium]|nr:FtsH protease activity modulator HflK [Acidobacteriota bacterium]